MKRKKDDGARKVYPVFHWVECMKCECEMVREYVWKFDTGPYYGGKGREQHLCITCASTIDDANNIFIERQSRVLNSKLPPPPPCRMLNNDFGGHCKECGSSLKLQWGWFGKELGCIQPECSNFYLCPPNQRPVPPSVKPVVAQPQPERCE